MIYVSFKHKHKVKRVFMLVLERVMKFVWLEEEAGLCCVHGKTIWRRFLGCVPTAHQHASTSSYLKVSFFFIPQLNNNNPYLNSLNYFQLDNYQIVIALRC